MQVFIPVSGEGPLGESCYSSVFPCRRHGLDWSLPSGDVAGAQTVTQSKRSSRWFFASGLTTAWIPGQLMGLFQQFQRSLPPTEPFHHSPVIIPLHRWGLLCVKTAQVSFILVFFSSSFNHELSKVVVVPSLCHLSLVQFCPL